MPENSIKTGSVYLLPGRGDGLNCTLGRIINSNGFMVQGRAITPEYQALGFSEQLGLVKADFQAGFWGKDKMLIGHSYGAYLLLHTLAEMPPFPGSILLISPVLGPGVAANRHYGSLPPRAGRLMELARHGRFPGPAYMEIHIGANDNGCDPKLAQEFASHIAAALVHVVPGVSHSLPESYLTAVMRNFLKTGRNL